MISNSHTNLQNQLQLFKRCFSGYISVKKLKTKVYHHSSQFSYISYSVPYTMQPEGQKSTKSETSIQNAAHLLQWTLPTFAKSFRINSLPCFISVGYQLNDNSVTNIIVFHKQGSLCWTVCLWTKHPSTEWIHY